MNILICGDSFKSITGLSEVAINIFKYFKSRHHNVAYCIIDGRPSVDTDAYNNIYLQDLEDFKFYNATQLQENFDKTIIVFPDLMVQLVK